MAGLRRAARRPVAKCDDYGAQRRKFRDIPWRAGLNANLDDMGYRGDDAARARADSRRKLPWRPSSARERDSDHVSGAGSGVYEQGPRRDGYDQHGYPGGPSAGPDGGGWYGRSGGYSIPGDYGRDGGGYSPGGYDGPDPGGYDRPAGGFPDNDWYGDSRAGGFADTTIHARPSVPDGYRPSDYDRGARAALPAPPADRPPGSADMLAQTRQQRVLDDRQYAAYPGYENVEDQSGLGGYGPGGYPAQPGYDYDDYADFTPDYEVPAPTTANPAYIEPAPTTGNPAYAELAPDYDDDVEFGAGPGYEDSFDGQGGPGESGGGPGRTGKAGKAGKKAKGGKKGKTGKPRRRRRKVVVLGGSVFCLVVALAAVYHFLFQPSSQEASANAPLPSPGSTSSATAACVKQFGQYCHIEFRTNDPKPLKISELYPPAFLNEKDHISFQRIGTRTDKNCSDAVIGSALTSALDKGSCSQALRASYVSGKGSSEIMGTIGVINLKTTNQAHYAGKLVGSSDFLAPLATSSGVGANLGKSTGVMQASFKGHYLILTWAELANEATPSKSDNKNLMRFEDDLVAGTANIALSQRMVSGQPGAGT